MTSKIRADYEQLSQIASTFGQQAECARQLLEALQKDMATLQGGDWVGKSADKFYAEMKSTVLPAMARVAAAMNEAATTTAKISRVMKQAEDDAAALFRLDGMGAALDPGQATAPGTSPASAFASGGDGTPGAGPGGSTGGAGGSPAATAEEARQRAANAVDPRAAQVQPVLDQGRHLKEMYEDAVRERQARRARYDEAVRLNNDPREILRLEAELVSIQNAERIYKAEMTQKYNEAIDLTVRLYNIDVSAANGKPEYDYNVNLGGFTDTKRIIGSGRDGVMHSPGWLASTLMHEAMHAQQMKEGRVYPIGGGNQQGTLINDIECFQVELDHADRNGLTTAEVDSIRESLEKRYLQLDEANQKRVNRRIFTPAPSKK
jgi:WXG100 family type VII secretion target